MAYVEALACGVPVIATRCGGPEVFITERNGIMVDVNNVDQLADAMLLMREKVDNYRREEIALDIRKSFSPDSVAKRIMQLYDKVIVAPGGPSKRGMIV